MIYKFFKILFLFLMVSSCATTYKPINTNIIPFKELILNENISYASRQGVLYNTKNYKYAKKELSKNYTITAFKIVNNSELPIAVKDLLFKCGGTNNLQPIPMQDAYQQIKQKAGMYWLYSLGVVPFWKCKDCAKIPLPVGVIVAGINFGIANKANKKIKANLVNNDLYNKIIQPHDTIIGYLPFKGTSNCGEIYIDYQR